MSGGIACWLRASSFALLIPGSLAAQDAAFDPGLEAERERALEERRTAVEEFQPKVDLPGPGPAQAAGGPCFDVREITVTGTTVLPARELGEIISAYVPGCLQGADIQAVMRDIDAAYAERGHITTKTYIPPQNILSGSLQLSVLEGKTEGLFLVNKTGIDQTRTGERQLAMAFPGVKGRVFQLRDFEQGLDQMNRLESVDAKLRLQPGAEPGGSNVIVQRIQEDAFRGYAGWDTFGSKATGRNVLSFDLEWDDALGLNDFWTIGLASSENTNAVDFYANVPYGYWNFEVGSTYSEYLTPLTDFAELYGKSYTYDFGASRLISRDQTSLNTVSMGLQLRRSHRYINNVRLTPQRLSVVDLGFRRIKQKGQARYSYDGTFKVGLKAFGASDDPSGIKSDEPHAQFVKFEGGWFRQGPLGDLGVLINDLRVQYSPFSLYSAEQMALGSHATVRGYEESEAIGDLGAYIRNDLYLSDTLFKGRGGWIQEQIPLLRSLRHRVFLDAGVTYDHARHKWEKVAGLGYSISFEKGPVFAEAFVSGALIHENSVPFVDDENFFGGSPTIGINVTIKAF